MALYSPDAENMHICTLLYIMASVIMHKKAMNCLQSAKGTVLLGRRLLCLPCSSQCLAHSLVPRPPVGMRTGSAAVPRRAAGAAAGGPKSVKVM